MTQRGRTNDCISIAGPVWSGGWSYVAWVFSFVRAFCHWRFWAAGWWYVAWACFAFCFYRACQWIGYCFGLLIGASTSPIASTVAPLVFGLLAAIGIGVAREMSSKLSKLWFSVLVAIGISTFCQNSLNGISAGINARTDPYPSIRSLLGDAWQKVDPELVPDLYTLRWEFRKSNVHWLDFSSIISDVILPVVADESLSKEEKRKIIRNVSRAGAIAPVSGFPGGLGG